MVGASPSSAGGSGSIPGWELRSHVPLSQKTKDKTEATY